MRKFICAALHNSEQPALSVMEKRANNGPKSQNQVPNL